jgi:hypothetical protein
MLAYCEEKGFLDISMARSKVPDAVTVVMDVTG